jgi:hypothetical protein
MVSLLQPDWPLAFPHPAPEVRDSCQPNARAAVRHESPQGSTTSSNMTSVFSSLVRPPKLLSRAGQTAGDSLAALPARAPSADSSDRDLGDLNAALQTLADIFPDLQPEVFREMLSSLGPESRVQVVTEQLLRNGARWARGRYRMPAEQEEQRAVAHKYKYRNVDAGKDTRGTRRRRRSTANSRG